MNARTRNIALAAAGIALVAALVAWWFHSMHRVTTWVDLPVRGEATWNRLYPLQKALRASGRDARSRRRLQMELEPLEQQDTVVMLQDTLGLQADETYDLLDWVEGGGHLVVGLPQGVAVFLDGVRMNEPEASQVNFDLLPMDHIQRIEILSGNGSLLGRNALGGAVNLVTARGTGPTSGLVELSGGSFGAARGEAHVSGLTKGHGFSGTVKRWNTHIGPKAHGSKYHRGPGSMGANTSPGRVFKNKRLPGQYGVENVTIQRMEVVKVDAERNFVMIKGAVPGARGALLMVRNSVKQ